MMVKKTIFGPTLVYLVFINRKKNYEKCFAEKLDNREKLIYFILSKAHKSGKGKSAALFSFLMMEMSIMKFSANT